MTKNLRPFHLAFPARDLEETRDWYTEILGCSVGRESSDWIDFNLFGHQIVAHLSDIQNSFDINQVDGENVPVRHFGVILKPLEWNQLKEKFILNKRYDPIFKVSKLLKEYVNKSITRGF